MIHACFATYGTELRLWMFKVALSAQIILTAALLTELVYNPMENSSLWTNFYFVFFAQRSQNYSIVAPKLWQATMLFIQLQVAAFVLPLMFTDTTQAYNVHITLGTDRFCFLRKEIVAGFLKKGLQPGYTVYQSIMICLDALKRKPENNLLSNAHQKNKVKLCRKTP